MSDYVERRVVFFRLVMRTDDAGKRLSFDAGTALAAVDQLSFATRERYLVVRNEDAALACWVHAGSKSRHRASLALIRHSALPALENAGTVTPLPVQAGDGLVEQSHLVFFPNNVLGAEFNFHAPRVQRLCAYFRDKISATPGVELPIGVEHLISGQAVEQLKRLKSLHLFRMKITASEIETMREINAGLGKAFAAAKNMGRADEVEIVLRAKHRKHAPLAPALAELVPRWLARSGSGTSKLQVVGLDAESGMTEHLDLLNDVIVETEKIELDSARSRAVSSKSAFAAIERAYERRKADIERATGVEVTVPQQVA